MSKFDVSPPPEPEMSEREIEIRQARETLVRSLSDRLPDAAQGQPIQVTDRYILEDLRRKLGEYQQRIGRLRLRVIDAPNDIERSHFQNKVDQMEVRIPAMEKLASGQSYYPLRHYDATVGQNPEFPPADTADSIFVVSNYTLPQGRRAETYKE